MVDYYSEIREFLESNGGFWEYGDYPFCCEIENLGTIDIFEIFIDDDDDLAFLYYDDSYLPRTIKVNNLPDPDNFLEKAYYLL